MKNKLFLIGIIAMAGLFFSMDFSPKNPAVKMQDFIIKIAKYARKYDANFIIIPQNGEELAFNNANPDKGLNVKFLEAIDGFGIEELYYNGTYKPNEYRIGLLKKIKNHKSILVSEFVTDTLWTKDAIDQNEQAGFLSFVRTPNNYHYEKIPTKIHQENNRDITSLKEVKNFLYLINDRNFKNKSTFIDSIANTNYDLVFIDLYHKGELLTKEAINQLKHKKNGGKRLVVGYMNIGAAETYRRYWNRAWQIGNPSWLKKKYEGYDNEFWVEYWNKEWQKIIVGNDDSYLKKIIAAGFDGVYLDNVEAYYFLYND